MLYQGTIFDDMHWIVLVLLKITITLTFPYSPESQVVQTSTGVFVNCSWKLTISIISIIEMRL